MFNKCYLGFMGNIVRRLQQESEMMGQRKLERNRFSQR